MKGRNLGLLWDSFGGKYLTNKCEVGKVLGIGYEKVCTLLSGLEQLAVGKGTYYRTMDVIDVVENNFTRKGT
ncbi:MAG: hypothetical protein IJ043_01450 [Clostridia bacterium]|nr:hypothetical protein [Clostridia bacterium]